MVLQQQRPIVVAAATTTIHHENDVSPFPGPRTVDPRRAVRVSYYSLKTGIRGLTTHDDDDDNDNNDHFTFCFTQVNRIKIDACKY